MLSDFWLDNVAKTIKLCFHLFDVVSTDSSRTKTFSVFQGLQHLLYKGKQLLTIQDNTGTAIYSPPNTNTQAFSLHLADVVQLLSMSARPLIYS